MRRPQQRRIARINLKVRIRVAYKETRALGIMAIIDIRARRPIRIAMIVRDKIAIILKDEIAAASTTQSTASVGVPEGLAVLVDDEVAVGLEVVVEAAVGDGEGVG